MLLEMHAFAGILFASASAGIIFLKLQHYNSIASIDFSSFAVINYCKESNADKRESGNDDDGEGGGDGEGDDEGYGFGIGDGVDDGDDDGDGDGDCNKDGHSDGNSDGNEDQISCSLQLEFRLRNRSRDITYSEVTVEVTTVIVDLGACDSDPVNNQFTQLPITIETVAFFKPGEILSFSHKLSDSPLINDKFINQPLQIDSMHDALHSFDALYVKVSCVQFDNQTVHGCASTYRIDNIVAGAIFSHEFELNKLSLIRDIA